jgi:flagellar hook assembly protein FlgD
VFRLVQNAPNPFNPITKIAYHVPQTSDVTIRVYDVSGRVVATLVDGEQDPGVYAVVWDGRSASGESVGSGIYFCTMEAGSFHASRKMTLLK